MEKELQEFSTEKEVLESHTIHLLEKYYEIASLNILYRACFKIAEKIKDHDLKQVATYTFVRDNETDNLYLDIAIDNQPSQLIMLNTKQEFIKCQKNGIELNQKELDALQNGNQDLALGYINCLNSKNGRAAEIHTLKVEEDIKEALIMLSPKQRWILYLTHGMTDGRKKDLPLVRELLWGIFWHGEQSKEKSDIKEIDTQINQCHQEALEIVKNHLQDQNTFIHA